MVTTFTLDEDVAALLEQVRSQLPDRVGQLVNEALRSTLQQAIKPNVAEEPYRTPSRDAGVCLLPSLDNTEEVLDYLEGPFRK